MKEANEILQKVHDAVGKILGEIHTELIKGPAAESIINVAKIRGSMVIVMGSAVSTIAKLVHGSANHKVVSHASCPVEIIRERVVRLVRNLQVY